MELISRDEAIVMLEDMEGRRDEDGYIRVYKCDAIDNLRSLPTVEERKEGEWIFKTVFPNDKSEFPMGYLVCSVCGSHHSNSMPCNYCDNCGAKMKGE